MSQHGPQHLSFLKLLKVQCPVGIAAAKYEAHSYSVLIPVVQEALVVGSVAVDKELRWQRCIFKLFS